MVIRVVVSIVLSVLLAGCIIEPADPAACDCPELERIVTSIDWVEGEAPRQPASSKYVEDDSGYLIVDLFFDGDAESAVARIQQLIEDTGITVLEQTGGSITILGTGFGAQVFSLDPIQVHVQLEGVPDEDAAEVLQPLVDAIGTR